MMRAQTQIQINRQNTNETYGQTDRQKHLLLPDYTQKCKNVQTEREREDDKQKKQ